MMVPWLLALIGCDLNVPVTKDCDAGDTVMVIVAARDLFAGQVISEADLYAVEIPPERLTPGLDVVHLSPELSVGQEVSARILANEFIRTERLGGNDTDNLRRWRGEGRVGVTIAGTARAKPGALVRRIESDPEPCFLPETLQVWDPGPPLLVGVAPEFLPDVLELADDPDVVLGNAENVRPCETPP